jgi:DNA-binding CsgD family transcriptional regulator
MTSFNIFCHELIDAWLQSDSNTRPEDLYAAVLGKLTIKMGLSVVGTVPDDPYDWQFRRVRDFGFKSPQLDRMKREFPDAPLRDLNRGFVDDAIIPAYLSALELRRPTIDMVKVKLIGIRIGYERLILPQKSQGKPGWCISLAEGRFFMPPVQDAKTDTTDDNVIQLLIEGHTAKEIAQMLNLSPRTIEHRIDKLKDRFDARNLVHLVAKLVATQVARKG